ncbi:hypothetical protein ASD93_08455 [Microbacterium sp. Root180]|nr:hypothetical protein ASD93_08455 [Microbacterium sp. Root180]
MDTTPIPGIEAQHDLIRHLEGSQFGWDIVVGDAFVRGMRDIGYKSTAFALSELFDNSVQAGAGHIDLLFGFDQGHKPTKIAIVDDGHGMVPAMVRASLVWGAGTRHNNRVGFGKYGYGLPSASVSQARRVTVYSKTESTDWTSAYLDVDEIGDGKWTSGNRIEMPKETQERPPRFVFDELKRLGRADLDHGTVIIWENLDRVDLRQRDALRGKLVTEIGIIYRNYLLDTPISVDGQVVEPCDPLFLTEGFRYYDLDEDRAVAYTPATLEVADKQTGEVIGRMRVRFSRFPASFFRKPEAKAKPRPNPRRDMNERLGIADSNNGIIFLRNGRQIDVVRPPRQHLGVLNATTDRFWAVEVDFEATLDDYFSITTSKQQVTPSDAIWDMLKDKAGIFAAINQMKSDYEKNAKVIREAAEGEDKKPSIAALEEAKKFQTQKAPVETPVRKKEADENFKREVDKKAKETGIDRSLIEQELTAQQAENHYAIEFEDLPGAPFYRCIQRGAQRVLFVNQAHRFYSDLYMGHGTNPRLRAALEVLLLTLGDAEVNADPDSERRTFYERERASVWSPNLDDTLKSLGHIDLVTSPDSAEAAEAA